MWYSVAPATHRAQRALENVLNVEDAKRAFRTTGRSRCKKGTPPRRIELRISRLLLVVTVGRLSHWAMGDLMSKLDIIQTISGSQLVSEGLGGGEEGNKRMRSCVGLLWVEE